MSVEIQMAKVAGWEHGGDPVTTSVTVRLHFGDARDCIDLAFTPTDRGNLVRVAAIHLTDGLRTWEQLPPVDALIEKALSVMGSEPRIHDGVWPRPPYFLTALQDITD